MIYTPSIDDVPTTEAIRCFWSIGNLMYLWKERREQAEAEYGPEFDAWLEQVKRDEYAKGYQAGKEATGGQLPCKP